MGQKEETLQELIVVLVVGSFIVVVLDTMSTTHTNCSPNKTKSPTTTTSSVSVDSKQQQGRRKENRKQQQQQLPPFNLHKDPQNLTFEDGFKSVVNLLYGRKNIAVLLGAGISVSCGIPDFRTEGSGIYSTLNAEVRTIFEKKGIQNYLVFENV